MTQTQANDDGRGIGRRRFVQIGIGATAASAGIGAGSQPAAAQSCDPEESISCSYGDEPDYGVSYLVGQVKEHFSGLGSDEEISQLQEETLWNQTHYDARTIQSANDSVLTTLSNLLENAKSVAYQQGRAAIFKGLNNGLSVDDALQEGISEATSYLLTNQKNLLERWNVVVTQIQNLDDRAISLESMASSDLFDLKASSKSDIRKIQQEDITLLDGSVVDHFRVDFGSNSGIQFRLDPQKYYTDGVRLVAQENPYSDDGDRPTFIDLDRWKNTWTEIEQIDSDVESELQSFANGIADKYAAGDISVEDIATPRDLWEMSSDDSDTPYAAADLAGLGLEVNQQSSVVIELLNDATKLEGSVYLSQSPIGQALIAGNVYDPGLSRSSGDTIEDYAGSESDPIPIDGLAFIAYNTDNGSTYDQINQPFKVQSVFGEDGQELQSASFEPSTGQQTTTTNIDELRSELQSLNDEIIELEEERRELATGGNGAGGNTGGIIAAAAGVGGFLALLLGGGN